MAKLSVGRQYLCRQKHGGDNSGQALIEFALGLMVIISFFFFFVKLAAVFAIANYIQYATFMSARAYQSSSLTEEDQIFRAGEVLRKTVGNRWKNLARGKGGDGSVIGVTGATVGIGPYFEENPFRNFWNQGVTYSFQSALTFYPFSGQGKKLNLNLTSETWLGREESIEECRQKKQNIKSNLQGINPTQIYWDGPNGGC